MSETKRFWEPMELSSVGHVSQVVEGGGGKLSIVADDMGDTNKPKGQE